MGRRLPDGYRRSRRAASRMATTKISHLFEQYPPTTPRKPTPCPGTPADTQASTRSTASPPPSTPCPCRHRRVNGPQAVYITGSPVFPLSPLRLQTKPSKPKPKLKDPRRHALEFIMDDGRNIVSYALLKSCVPLSNSAMIVRLIGSPLRLDM
jgi:hypothetical protein